MNEKENQKNEKAKKGRPAADGKDSMADEVIEGAKAICKFINRSEPTLMSYIQRFDFQKKGIVYKRGGIWIANRKKLREWYLNELTGNQKKPKKNKVV